VFVNQPRWLLIWVLRIGPSGASMHRVHDGTALPGSMEEKMTQVWPHAMQRHPKQVGYHHVAMYYKMWRA
jgi:hypothetical protein